MASATPDIEVRAVRPAYRAEEVARLTGLALPTVHEKARESPDVLGAFRIGRAVRFRRDVVDRLVGGDEAA